MEYIDLHMHSTFSDGTDTPEELVRKSLEAGLKMIALTDHNTFAGISAFRQALSNYEPGTGEALIKGIEGVELSTGWIEDLEREQARLEALSASDPDLTAGPPPEAAEIHLLGYFPRGTDFQGGLALKPIRKVIEEFHLNKIRQNESMILAMDAAGIRGREGRLTLEDFYASARSESRSGNYNRVHIANYLTKAGAVSSKQEAFDRFISKESPFYIPCRRVPIKKAVRAIHDGGGTAVIAHVGEYKFDEARLEAFFEDSISWDIDGFELLHPHNSPETAAKILAFADRFRRQTGRVLLLTSGSDYHGKNKLNKPGLPWDPGYAW